MRWYVHVGQNRIRICNVIYECSAKHNSHTLNRNHHVSLYPFFRNITQNKQSGAYIKPSYLLSSTLPLLLAALSHHAQYLRCQFFCRETKIDKQAGVLRKTQNGKSRWCLFRLKLENLYYYLVGFYYCSNAPCCFSTLVGSVSSAYNWFIVVRVHPNNSHLTSVFLLVCCLGFIEEHSIFRSLLPNVQI